MNLHSNVAVQGGSLTFFQSIYLPFSLSFLSALSLFGLGLAFQLFGIYGLDPASPSAYRTSSTFPNQNLLIRHQRLLYPSHNVFK
ncbi:hypothetical protein C8J55DRAFT_38658 [Lentinula edodes]|uniref:Uncharacterized protein n=1 Tax=Lentinula lateritia TaxID=40482 RepID=A0A9W9AJB5_9AGAR|nr:hypothetical protein C8J55DRAFT_38658 [Lentinula edodes]